MNPRCSAQRQQDEWFCPRCNWRWSVDEEPPGECPEVFRDGVAAMLRLMHCEAIGRSPARLRAVT